jgi:hypothetical protein
MSTEDIVSTYDLYATSAGDSVAYSHSSDSGGWWWQQGFYQFSCSSISVLFDVGFNYYLSVWITGSGGEATPSSQLDRRRKGYLGPVTL